MYNVYIHYGAETAQYRLDHFVQHKEVVDERITNPNLHRHIRTKRYLTLGSTLLFLRLVVCRK